MMERELRAVVQSCRIAHHIPGRLRVKLGGTPVALLGQPEAPALLAQLRGLEGVRAVSLNALSRSCTIIYDPSLILPSTWEDLLAGKETAPAVALLATVSRAG